MHRAWRLIARRNVRASALENPSARSDMAVRERRNFT